jgi:hypothetical protein
MTTPTETLTRSQAHRKLLAIGMPLDVVTHVLDHPDELLHLFSPMPTVVPSKEAVAIVEAYQRHCKGKVTTDPLDTVPPEERERPPCRVCDRPVTEHAPDGSGIPGECDGYEPPTPAPLAREEAPAEERTVGLYRKFEVRRVDGSSGPGGRHEHCDYLVLDWQHDPFTVPAARTYANACEAEYPALASDLRAKAAMHGPVLTPAEEAEIIASAPGQIGPGQTPIGRPPSTIAAAFEAMLAFFICLIGPRPHRKITPAEEIGALAACEVETDFTPDSPPTDLTRLRDLIQRAAEEYAQIRADASKRLDRVAASRRERKAADLAAGRVTEEKLREIDARTSGPGPLAEDGALMRRCMVEIRTLRRATEQLAAGDVAIPRRVLERLVDATQRDPDVREAREAAEHVLHQDFLRHEPARTDAGAARALAKRGGQ